jgi:PKD repeat protein
VGTSGAAPADLGAGRVVIAPTGTGAGAQFGNSVASAGDFNGDGHADVIVGSWARDFVYGDQGSASVYYGGPDADDSADLTFYGESFSDNFGTSVAPAGDVNGDGYTDLIVGAWLAPYNGSGTGRAYIFYGGPAPDAVPDVILAGAVPGDRFGIAVSSAGDLNNDGFSDVIVGASGNDVGGFDAGRAYVYFGGSSVNAIADLTLTGAAAGDAFGYAVAPAGDLNGDQYDDVVVGAYGAGGAGRTYVYYGGPGLDGTADRTFAGEDPGDNFGLSVAPAGDVDGDGNVDLIVGGVRNDAAGLDAGRAYLFRGGAGADEIADIIFTGAATNDNFGVSVSSAGDVNGDGFDDLIVGAWLNDARGPNAGRAYVYHGGPGADGIADHVLTGEVAGDRLGISVAGAGDFDGDGAADMIVGAYFNDFASPEAGRAYVVSASLSGTNHPPVLTAPASVLGAEGVLISLAITAADPDGDHVAIGALNRPVGSLFIDLGNNSGSFSWTPGFAQMGTYTVTFTGRDDRGANATPADLRIVVDDVNRGPIANPGGPYTGAVGVPITFNGTASADPDGSPLTYLWDFGDLKTATGATPLHAYGAGGTFVVTLTVGDGHLTHSATTISTIQDIFQARSFTTNSNRSIKLGSGKDTWCAEIEPVNSSFLITAVIPSTVVMKYAGVQVPAQAGKLSIGADRDANGVQEVAACFTKSDLRTLFAGLPNGTSTVTTILEGDLGSGGKFQATLLVEVVSKGGALAASLSPNPLNPAATLTFRTSRAGAVSISIYNLQGRLVRSLKRGEQFGAGYHDLRVDARGDHGESLPSGVYFYRVEAGEGTETGRFVIAK